MLSNDGRLASCVTAALKHSLLTVAVSIFVCAQGVPGSSFNWKPETFVQCHSVRLVLADAGLDIRDQDVRVERLRVNGRGTTAKVSAKVLRNLHTDATATISLAKVTSGRYLLRAHVSGQEVLGTIHLPDFSHLGKCVTDVEVWPLKGSLAIEEKN